MITATKIAFITATFSMFIALFGSSNNEKRENKANMLHPSEYHYAFTLGEAFR